MSRRGKAFQRACPTCGAGVGAPCSGPSGKRKAFHQARFTGEIVTFQRERRTGMVTESEHIEAITQEAIIAEEEKIRRDIANLIAPCASPIERVFIAAFYAAYRTSSVFFYGAAKAFSPPPFDGVHVYPQVSIDGYRVDFLIADQSKSGHVRYTVVECDGHDFHERTKQQASHDKARDRHFQRKGWKVVRFTGSDIWRDPGGAASDAFEIAIGHGEDE